MPYFGTCFFAFKSLSIICTKGALLWCQKVLVKSIPVGGRNWLLIDDPN
jgi:hypothetical protein